MSKKEVYGVIYVIENKVNGKKYVGQTVQGIKKRWSQHITSSRSKPSGAVHHAIRKYGEENFTIKKVDHSHSQSELDVKESLWIKKTKSMAPNGYNLTEGGYGSSGYTHTEKAKRAMSEKRSGDKNGSARAVIDLDTLKIYTTVKEASDALGLKTSNSVYRACRGYGYYRNNFAYYDDYLNNSIPPRGKRVKRATTKVVNINTKEVFNSMVEACKKYGLEHSNLYKACNNQINGTGGYSWAYYDDYIEGNFKIKKVQQKQPIINLDTLEIFETSVDAGNKYNVSRSNITYCCQGKRNKCGGYRWKYYKDYLRERGLEDGQELHN